LAFGQIILSFLSPSTRTRHCEIPSLSLQPSISEQNAIHPNCHPSRFTPRPKPSGIYRFKDRRLSYRDAMRWLDGLPVQLRCCSAGSKNDERGEIISRVRPVPARGADIELTSRLKLNPPKRRADGTPSQPSAVPMTTARILVDRADGSGSLGYVNQPDGYTFIKPVDEAVIVTFPTASGLAGSTVNLMIQVSKCKK
jgi:hypothetical protein